MRKGVEIQIDVEFLGKHDSKLYARFVVFFGDTSRCVKIEVNIGSVLSGDDFSLKVVIVGVSSVWFCEANSRSRLHCRKHKCFLSLS